MAQLALSAGGALVGGLLGGPYGASVGWALGGLAGAALFPPKGQDQTGPQIGDVQIQGSAYGTPLPLLFGTARLAGNVIWWSGIRRASSTSRTGGKGTPRQRTTTFQYFSSWAVSFCEGPAGQVRRMWFDDKLVFDASGASLQTEIPGLAWRFYPGDETQLPDPLIEANVGADNAVAYRGQCYIVFDDVPLERVGNRIPNVTAEIVMAGGLTVVETAATLPGTGYASNILAADWTRNTIWLRGGSNRLVAVDTSSMVGRFVSDTVPNNVAAMWVIPGGPLLYGASCGNSSPIYQIDPYTGAQLGVFGGCSSSLTTTTSNITVLSITRQGIIATVRGATTRNFLLLTPNWGHPVYCLDADQMSYVFGSQAAGHPRLFTPSGAGGFWVQGEQRLGATDCFYLLGRTGHVEAWRITLTEASRGISAASGLPNPGDTLGVPVARLADIPAAALGHAAEALTVWGVEHDLNDGSFLVQVSGTTNGTRLAKITADGTVLWQVATGAPTGNLGGNSRLAGRAYGISDLFNTTRVHDLATGAVLQQASLSNNTTISGASVWNSDINARFRWTIGGGFRRALLLRSASNSVTLASIADTLCRRAGLDPTEFDVSGLTQPVAGFVVARPMSAREALQPLASAYLFDTVESNDVLRFRTRGGAPVATLVHADLVRQGTEGVITEQRAQDAELPRSLTLRHIDAERSYETGAQRWQRPQSPTPTMRSREDATLDLPVVLTPGEAKADARRLLTATWRERLRYRATGTTQHLALEPTDVVTLTLADDSTVRARIISTETGADWTTRLECVAEAAADYMLTAQAEGGTGRAPDVLPAPYAVAPLAPNLPLLRDGDDTGGTALRGYAMVGAYAGQSFAGATLLRRLNGGTAELAGSLVLSVPWGNVTAAIPAPASYWTWDSTTTITLLPQAGAADLVSATDGEVLNGANLAALLAPDGRVELIQFATATANADGTITLSRLLRGRRGTEDAGAMPAGCVLVLLDDDALLLLQLTRPLSALGGTETLQALSLFETEQTGATVTRLITGRAERPLAPCQITGTRDGAQNLTISWARRTRLGGELLDGTGTVPLGEASEAYEVQVFAPSLPPGAVYSASSTNGANTPANAGDGNLATLWGSAAGPPQSLVITFLAAETISDYRITARASFLNDTPRDWSFEGLVGGVWAVLDSRVNQTGWVAGESRLYSIATPRAVTAVRLVTTANQGSTNVALAELAVFRAIRTLTSTAPSVVYTAAQQAIDFGATQPAITLAVAQVSASVGRGINARATL